MSCCNSNNNSSNVTTVSVTDLCTATVPEQVGTPQELEQLRAIVEAQQSTLCSLSTGCLELNKATTYIYEPFEMYFYDIVDDNRFTVPTGSLDAAATVKDVFVTVNGVQQPQTGTNAATIITQGFGYSLNTTTNTSIDVVLDTNVGFAGSPAWVYVKGYVRKSLQQISGC